MVIYLFSKDDDITFIISNGCDNTAEIMWATCQHYQ